MDIKNRDLGTVERIDDRHAQPILPETALEHAAHSSDLSAAQNGEIQSPTVSIGNGQGIAL
jgi:hypothetical protein